jgi:hypothetical protein
MEIFMLGAPQAKNRSKEIMLFLIMGDLLSRDGSQAF